jgi:DNA-binding CsgD family transcriptional regulator
MLPLCRGDLREPAAAVEGLGALLAACDNPFLKTSALNIGATVLVAAGEYERSTVLCERMMEIALEAGIDFPVGHGLVTKAAALTGLREYSAAARACSQVQKRVGNETSLWLERNLAIQQARLSLSFGDLARASEHLALGPAGPESGKFGWAEYDAYQGLVAAARGIRKEARQFIDRSFELSAHAEARGVALIARAILAMRSSHKCTAGTREDFGRALACGHLDAIVIGCRAQPGLAKVIAAQGEHREALRTVLAGSGDEPIARAAGLDVPRTTRKRDRLSPRELEVYELLAQGRTNREIARNLFITESTTKIHVRHIFEKLGVRTRVEAARAWSSGD